MQKRPDEWLKARSSEFRKRMNIDGFQCPHIESIIELAGVEYDIKLVRRFDDEMPDKHAFADCENRTIYYRESLRSDLRRADKHARFVFLEELGHIILGHSGLRNRSVTSRLYEKANPQVHIDEREARRFAAGVLAPLERIESSWDELKISDFSRLVIARQKFGKKRQKRSAEFLTN